MMWPVTIADNTDDETRINVAGDEVHVIPDTGNGPAPMFYSPAKARQFAALLLSAADDAEANR